MDIIKLAREAGLGEVLTHNGGEPQTSDFTSGAHECFCDRQYKDANKLVSCGNCPRDYIAGEFDLKTLEKLAETIDPVSKEGFVVRVTDRVAYDEFDLKFAKWVRKGHVQTNKHWMSQEVIPNGLKHGTDPVSGGARV